MGRVVVDHGCLRVNHAETPDLDRTGRSSFIFLPIAFGLQVLHFQPGWVLLNKLVMERGYKTTVDNGTPAELPTGYDSVPAVIARKWLG